MEDHMPSADIIHDVEEPASGDEWREALRITGQGTRSSQHCGSVLGRRHGQPVRVYIMRSYDGDQDTGPKGYLEDEEVIWRTEAVCFPLTEALPSFAAVGDTIVAHGRYGLDLTTDGVFWMISDESAAPRTTLLAKAYPLTQPDPSHPAAWLRLNVGKVSSDAPNHAADWEEVIGTAPTATGSVRLWRRQLGDDEIEIEFRIDGEIDHSEGVADRILNSFWVVA